MDILLLCNKSPYPPKEGGPIAMNAIIEGLVKAGHKVKVLAINTNKYNIDVNKIPSEYRKKTEIETVYIDLSIKIVDAFLNLFTKKSYHVQRFISNDFDKKIIEILSGNKFDIIQLETLFITPYINTIRKYSKARIVLRAHNIEYLIWERVAKSCKNPLKKFYLNHLSKTLKNYEIQALEKYDGITSITKKDADDLKDLGTKTPVIDISFGIDAEQFKVDNSKTEFPSLFHIGAMNWIPNEEGIKWFLENVWEKIHKEFPELKFYLAGREMPQWLYNSTFPNVEILGEVESATDFIRSKSVMIVPLLSGSGIRIKIIEGMAMGKTIISTTIGAEGINCENGKNILIANTSDEFLMAVKKCVEDKDFTEETGKNARYLIDKDHSNKKIIERLTNFYQDIL